MKIKGFIFTVDAVFSLIVATAAVGILVYANFTEPASFQVTTSEAYSVAQTLMQTNLASFASQYAVAAVNSSAAYATWPYFAGGGPLAATSASGPMLPMLLFQFSAAAPISTPVSVDSGMAVFGTGSTIYLVNATTGKQILSKGISGSVLYPIIYKGSVIYANSTGYLTAIQKNGNVIWRSSVLSLAASTPLTIANNYIAFGSGSNVIVASPLNGNIISTLPLAAQATVPAYISGELIVSTSTAGQNYLYAFSLNSAGITQAWQRALATGTTVSPSATGNMILVGSGNQIFAMTTGGSTRWIDTISTGSITGAGSILGGNAYYTFSNIIWEINFSCGCATNEFSIPATANVIPSTTQTQLYTVAGLTNFVSYNITGSDLQRWSITLPASTNLAFQDVPLAYGNAYLTGGSTLYAFGTCSAPGGESILQAIGAMYLNGEGGCATQLLNSSYRSSNLGIFINGSYAPSLGVASFNGKNSHINLDSEPTWPTALTVSTWFNTRRPTTSNGVAQELFNNNQVFLRLEGGASGVENQINCWVKLSDGSVEPRASSGIIAQPNTWYYTACTWNGNTLSIYVDGALAGTSSRPGSLISNTVTAQIGAGEQTGLNGHPFNGVIADMQLYDGALNGSQIESKYRGGMAAVPVQNTSLVSIIAWYPLDGDANDYSGFGNVGYPSNVVYVSMPFSPIPLINSYEVSAASFPLSLRNVSKLYKVGVVIWR